MQYDVLPRFQESMEQDKTADYRWCRGERRAERRAGREMREGGDRCSQVRAGDFLTGPAVGIDSARRFRAGRRLKTDGDGEHADGAVFDPVDG